MKSPDTLRAVSFLFAEFSISSHLPHFIAFHLAQFGGPSTKKPA
jgi:hypothetical protein